MKSLSNLFPRKTLVPVIALVAVFASIMPVFALADVLYCNGNYGFYPNQTSCSNSGTLNVVMNLLNNQDKHYSPNLFQVSVSGVDTNTVTFPGSNPGTNVALGAGSYSVNVAAPQGFSFDYSQGCSGVMGQNGSALCVVTVSNSVSSIQYPTIYQYPAVPQVLSCAPGFETVRAGQTASFTAYSGLGNYTWSVNGKTYINAGQTINIPMEQTGTALVTVNSGSQTATCTVDVVGVGSPIPSNIVVNTTPVITAPAVPVYTTSYTAPGTYNQYGYPQTQVSSQYYPQLPNTGFEPITAAQIVFAIVALIASGILLYPYVRKASTVGII
ncbi:MAG: hypothetical protein JWO43_224 [Candidatus Adlerbacteria bacterium]|nr:hypothetical protein [Candidatus Adlerbacteria bacterium]